MTARGGLPEFGRTGVEDGNRLLVHDKSRRPATEEVLDVHGGETALGVQVR